MRIELLDRQGWNPRYLQYCRVHGYDPANCPDRSNAEFIIWSNQQLGQAFRQHPEFFTGRHGLHDHAGYDAWLEIHAKPILPSSYDKVPK